MAPDYTPRQVAELLQLASGLQLIDVREDDEWAAGRIAGALHLRLADLAQRADEIDRERPVVFYCRSGSRSGMAADAFAEAGYQAHNMTGGLQAWVAGGLPLNPPDGSVA